jgi:dGTPase
LEVAHFAKGLGLGVEKYLLQQEKIGDKEKGFIPSILEVAGLIHDIGNPPFGHFGEQVIQDYFRHLSKKKKIKEKFDSLSKKQQGDFRNFDGNVQGFRILRKLGLIPYNLTMPTLATIIKYPYSSTSGNEKNGKYSQKKFGYFDSEETDYNQIINKLGLQQGQRHPLTYLLEAADDIAYSVSDIEDGHKLGIITLDKIKKAFTKNNCGEELQDVEQYESNMDLYIYWLRIKKQSKMLIECTNTFNQNFDDILKGVFDKDLIKASNAGNIRSAFEDLSLCNFSNREVLKHELLGQEVISFLLNLFYGALFSNNILNEDEKLNRKSKEYKIYSLISDNYKKLACGEGEEFPTDNYKKFMLITDYISGMTDSFALNLYKELKGYSF